MTHGPRTVSVIASLVAAAVITPVAHASASLGDWEGSDNKGQAVSFAIDRAKLNGHHQLVIRDLVVVQRERCTSNGAPQAVYPSAVELAREVVPGHDGRFIRNLPGGSVRGRINATAVVVSYHLHLRFTVPPLLGPSMTDVCDASLHATAQPATRMTVADGLWRGVAADGESVRFMVTAGGRIVQGGYELALDPHRQPFTIGTLLVSCSGTTCEGNYTSRCGESFSGMNALIPADGRLDAGAYTSQGGSYTVDFTGPSAVSGSWSSPSPSPTDGGSCDEQWTAARAGP